MQGCRRFTKSSYHSQRGSKNVAFVFKYSVYRRDLPKVNYNQQNEGVFVLLTFLLVNLRHITKLLLYVLYIDVATPYNFSSSHNPDGQTGKV